MDKTAILDLLDSQTDEALNEIIEHSQGLLTIRRKKRQNEALLMIRQMAKQYDIAATFKRGRRRKAEGAQGQ